MSGEPTQPIREYTWDEVVELAETLGSKIAAGGVLPTVIIGILRGGAFPSLMLSHMFNVRRLYAINAAVTLTEEPRAPRGEPVIQGVVGLPDLSSESVLLVDDVTNTGDTLRAVLQSIKEARAIGTLRSACLLWDTVSPGRTVALTQCQADFWASEVHAWVKFPWEGSL
jgi:hypothetical protein